MAVIGNAREQPFSRPCQENMAGKRFTRKFLVETNLAHDGPVTVLGAPGLPAINSPHPDHPAARCITRIPERADSSRFVWYVQCEYSTEQEEFDNNPLTQKPELEWDFEPFDEPLVGTANPNFDPASIPPAGNPDGRPTTETANQGLRGYGVVNAAGDPFDPAPTLLNYLPVVRLTRNEPTFDAQFALYFGNTVNKLPWNGLTYRQAWLKPIQAQAHSYTPQTFGTSEIRYWRVRYTFVLKAESWDLLLLNIGYNYLDISFADGEPPKKAFKSIDGRPTMDLLKANGARYHSKAYGDSNDEVKTPIWLRYRVRREVDFGPLNINLGLNLNQLTLKKRT